MSRRSGRCKTLSTISLKGQKRAFLSFKCQYKCLLTGVRQLKKPMIRTEEKTLYYAFPVSLEQQTRPNLKRKLDDLLVDGEEVGVSDPSFAIDFKFKLRFV